MHGQSARDCWWLWRLSARMATADAGAVLVFSARLAPPLVPRACAARHDCLALLQTAGASPVWRAFAGDGGGGSGGVDSACAHASPLDALLEQGQRARAARLLEAPAGTAALVAIEDAAGLLLAHRIADVVAALSALASAGPVAAFLDVAVVGEAAFTALAAQASVIIRLDGDSVARGVATVTERLLVSRMLSGHRRRQAHTSTSIPCLPSITPTLLLL